MSSVIGGLSRKVGFDNQTLPESADDHCATSYTTFGDVTSCSSSAWPGSKLDDQHRALDLAFVAGLATAGRQDGRTCRLDIIARTIGERTQKPWQARTLGDRKGKAMPGVVIYTEIPYTVIHDGKQV